MGILGILRAEQIACMTKAPHSKHIQTISNFSKCSNSSIAAAFCPVDFRNWLGLRVALCKPHYKAVYLRSSFKIQYKLAAVKRTKRSSDIEIILKFETESLVECWGCICTCFVCSASTPLPPNFSENFMHGKGVSETKATICFQD